MLCTTCQRELDDASSRCEACLQSRTAVASDSAGAEAEVTQKSRRSEIAAAAFLVISVVIVISWSGFVTFSQYQEASSEALGFWIGTLLIPFLVSYLVAGVKKRQNSVRFSFCLLFLGMVLPSFSLQSRRPKLSTAEIIREYAGTKPLDQALPENEKVEASVARAYFDELRQFSESYTLRDAQLAVQLASLYTAGSFAGKKSMDSALAAVSQKLALDKEAVQRLDDAPAFIRFRLDKTSLSESDKQDFLKGFQSSLSDSEVYRARRETLGPETNWVNATAGLYQFSIEHLKDLSVVGNKIQIANGTTRSQFNAKLAESKDLAAAYRVAAQHFNNLREASMKSVGVSASDLGLKK